MAAVFAAVWEQGGPAFQARHNLTSGEYQQAFDEIVGQGFRLTCVDGYVVNGEVRFAAVWKQGGPAFQARHNLTSAQYQQAFDQIVGQGFRLTWVSGYVVNGEVRFAAVWEQGGPAFQARHNLTAGEYQQAFDQIVGQGFRLTCVSGYEVDGQVRFAAVWEQGGPAFQARHNMTPGEYQQAFDQLAGQGFRPTCVSGYAISGQDRYAAVWEQGGPAFQARHGLTGSEYQQAFNQIVGQGFGLRFVTAHDSRDVFTLSHFTFNDDISAENRNRLIDRHRFAWARVSACGNLSADEKAKLNEVYRRAINHTTLNEPGVNASAFLNGSVLNVNFGVLFPQGDEEISQTLIHEMMHCAGFSHPKRRDPPAGMSCAAPDPNLFDCPNDNGVYYGTAPLRAEFCIAGDQSDMRFRASRKAAAESCTIGEDGKATLHTG